MMARLSSVRGLPKNECHDARASRAKRRADADLSRPFRDAADSLRKSDRGKQQSNRANASKRTRVNRRSEAESVTSESIVAVCMIGWFVPDRIRLMAERARRDQQIARTTRDIGLSAKAHCSVTHTASARSAASDVCFTSPTMLTTVHGTPLTQCECARR